MSLLTTRHWVIALSILAVVVIVAAALGVSDLASVQASNKYNQQREKLLADLRAAATQGYTAEDLTPITSGLKAVEGQKEPALLLTSPAFYSRRADQVAALDAQLTVRKKEVLDQAQADTSRQASAAKTGIEQDRSLGTPDADLTPLQQRLDQVARAQGGLTLLASTAVPRSRRRRCSATSTPWARRSRLRTRPSGGPASS